MKVKLWWLLVLLPAVAGAGRYDESLAWIEQHENDLLRISTAIGQVESGGNDEAYNASEKATGWLQIRPCYVTDVVDYYGYDYSLADRYDRAKATEIFVLYMARYLRHKPFNVEQIARTHCAGPDGMNQKCSLPYWRKVQRKLGDR